ANLRDQAAALDEQRAAYEQAARSVQALIDGGSVPEEYKPALKGAVGMLNAACDLIDATSESLRTAADKLEAGNANVQGEHDAVTAQIEQARSSVATLRATFGDEVRPAMDGLADEAGSFAASVAAGAARLNAAESDLSGSMGSATSSLSDAQGKISAMSSELGETSSKLRSFADSIDAALAAGDSEALREILTTDVEQFARALAAPVGVERVAVHPSENFGSAMAPLYTTIALFVGALLIMVVVKPTVSARAQEKLRDPKPRELFLGRFGVVALLSLAQTTLMGLGNMLFLQVQVAHPMLFMLCFWVAGLVFSSLIYAFVSAFANLGKAVAVLLLIIQVTGCGGSFPLQILPDFVQAISPFLPATHVVGAMRAAMFGTTGADFWVQIGELALFLIPAALIGLVLRKPFEKFMGWYIEKVEESKLIG
ncbi:MAG: YhgE/Pip family protein, partial [Eggerthellaceae bacterium]|nr:YhgE/Pip family protein [Eggerthellaceae bacterium]